MPAIDHRITRVFRDVFDNDEMEVTDATNAHDVKEGDSLAQVKLVIALEEEFDVKFTTHEVAKMKCVGDLKLALLSKNISG